ncbi:hypothetical protein Tco_0409187 [Tanacetum coccineum]
MRMQTMYIIQFFFGHGTTAMGVYPSQILSRCSAIDLGTPVMLDGCHASISKFPFKNVHNSVCALTESLGVAAMVAHSIGVKIVLRTVTILPFTGNLSIS